MAMYVVNQPVVLDATFTAGGVLTDPTAITLVVTDPAGTATTYNWPTPATITKSSTGTFTKTVTADSAGTWSYVWSSTGTAADVQDGTFDVFATAPNNNLYCTLAEVKQEKGLSDTLDDATLMIAIKAAARQIDSYCGRKFYQDAALVTREYFPDTPLTVPVDDISTLTGLVVKVDVDMDGAFETTLTINTDFLPYPRNAPYEFPVRPYEELRIVPVGSQAFFPHATYGRASVQVTAKFGWPAVPDDVRLAAIRQAAYLAKGKDAPLGGIELGNLGTPLFLRSPLHPQAQGLLSPYQKPAVG